MKTQRQLEFDYLKRLRDGKRIHEWRLVKQFTHKELKKQINMVNRKV